MNSGTGYHLQVAPSLVRHFPSRDFLLHDGDEEADLQREARIRSGDYLMTLSTELERIAQNLAVTNAPEVSELERIISELLYADRNYRITKR